MRPRCDKHAHCGENQAHSGRQVQQQQEQNCTSPEESDEILFEMFDTAGRDTAGLPIEGFEAELLGVLRVKLSDIWVEESDHQTSSCCSDVHGSLSDSAARRDDSTACAGRPDATAVYVDGATETRRRKDRWFGGIVSPSCSCQQGDANGNSPASGFFVEARLEVSWDGCRVQR